jgi:biofilm protein TabA
MYRFSFSANLLILGAFVLVFGGCAATKPTDAWFKKGKWYNGLTLTPYADINRAEFERQYEKNKARWDKAFEYLKNTDLESASTGKLLLDGDSVTVSITEGPTKPLEKATWESHRKMIDIQYIIRGKEKMGLAHLSKATVTKAYDASKDVANYTANGKYYTAEPGTIYIFFPSDVHRPTIKVDGYDVVKKIVIKVRYRE